MLKSVKTIVASLSFAVLYSGTAFADFALGYVDSLTATPGGIAINGWACRIWYPQYTYLSTIEVYESGPAGSGTHVASFHPNQGYRPDTYTICGAFAYTGFTNYFYWSNPNQPQYYWVYIKDDQTGELQLLAPTPFAPTY